MTPPLLDCRQLAKSYGTHCVLHQLTLALQPGMVVGLLGKNGAGKTTLLKCALGLMQPDSGEVTLFSEPAWNLSPAAKARLGYVPQTIFLYPWLNARQIIDYTASFYPHWNDALIENLLAQWELSASARIMTLSTGQQQKLAILLALGHEPDLLILDEPAAALDPVARRAFLATLLDLAGNPDRAMLFSTHLTADLERVASHVAILKEGALAYFGPLDELKEKVKRLHITAAHPFAPDAAFPHALDQQTAGNHTRVTLVDVTPALLSDLERNYQATIEVEDLNLDDIFLEMHHA